jgi:hypothetical protein
MIKCHVQTKMINTNSHGHGMYLPVLIIHFFTLPYNVILVRKSSRISVLLLFGLFNKAIIGFRGLQKRYNVQQASRVKPVTTGIIQKDCE